MDYIIFDRSLDKFKRNISVADRIDDEKGASNTQILWSACQALARAIKITSPDAAKDKSIRPLKSEIKTISKVACKYCLS